MRIHDTCHPLSRFLPLNRAYLATKEPRGLTQFAGTFCHSVTSFHREKKKKKEPSRNESASLFERKIIFQRSDTFIIVVLIVHFIKFRMDHTMEAVLIHRCMHRYIRLQRINESLELSFSSYDYNIIYIICIY